MLEELLEDIQLALDEFRDVCSLLEVLELLLVNRGHGCLTDCQISRYCSAMLPLLLAEAEAAHEAIMLYPKRLRED
jgi:hypothetical protein